jgi:ribosomal protein S8E
VYVYTLLRQNARKPNKNKIAERDREIEREREREREKTKKILNMSGANVLSARTLLLPGC